MAILVLVFALNSERMGGLLISKPVLAGGECSYSLYLFHPLFTSHFSNAVADFGKMWWVEPIFRGSVMVALSLLLAYGGYHIIEVPSRRFFRKYLGA